jgi:hypothetical protein
MQIFVPVSLLRLSQMPFDIAGRLWVKSHPYSWGVNVTISKNFFKMMLWLVAPTLPLQITNHQRCRLKASQ